MNSSANAAEVVYSLNGQRLSAGSAATQQPGTVYIKDGRKVMVTK